MRFTHPSQDQDGLDSAFTASTAELFKPLPTIAEIKDKLKEWIRMADEATPWPWLKDSPMRHVAGELQTHSVDGPPSDFMFLQEAADANFIATSRTAAPLAWKCLLLTIEVLPFCEELYGETLQSLREQFQPIFHLENR